MNRSIFKTISKSSRTTNRYQLRVNSTRQLSGWDSQNHPNSTNLNQDQRLSEPKARNGSIREKLKPDWLIQKEALKRNFPDGWNPPKKISRPSMTLLRTLHSQDPARFSLPVLSDRFKISPEAVRRILRSKWEPDPIKFEKLKDRWDEGSDGWIHYEKLETDQIPKNLASSLKSSDPRSSSSQNSDYLDHPGIYNSKESGGSFGRKEKELFLDVISFFFSYGIVFIY
ncbi:hypothetical protein BY996DRAFT_6953932 [Phakopsora pachyrhizi]|nr:hypothetical protein BY996DRAFT_6953932 [Phakopsora pachyrhizi]